MNNIYEKRKEGRRLLTPTARRCYEKIDAVIHTLFKDLIGLKKERCYSGNL